MNNFYKIFTYNKKTIKVAGTVDEVWFRAKDKMETLGYDTKENTMNNTLLKLDPEYKNNYKHIIEKVDTFTMSTSCTYNEGKEIYVNEPGQYNLII